jgi:acyl-CoA thioester hydrolase
MPTIAEIEQVPMFYESTVPAEYEDANGHLNISGYLVIHNEASWPFMASLGMDRAYVDERRMSIFDLEHHLRYLGEMVTGSPLRVHGVVADRSEKLLHGMFFLLDDSEGRLANTFEFVSAHVSLESRRSVPFSPEIAAAIDEQIALVRSLDWQLPLSGVLGLKR